MRTEAATHIREVLDHFEARNGSISAERIDKGGGTEKLVQMWRQMPEGERAKLYGHLDESAKSSVMLELVGRVGPSTSSTTAQLRQLKVVFDSRVAEAERLNYKALKARSLINAFRDTAALVDGLHPQLAAFMRTTIDRANEVRYEPDRIAVLRPAAAYVSDKLGNGPTTAADDVRDLRAMFDEKVADANRRRITVHKARALLRAIRYTIPLVERHDTPLATFMTQTVSAAEATESEMQCFQEILKPAANLISNHLKSLAKAAAEKQPATPAKTVFETLAANMSRVR